MHLLHVTLQRFVTFEAARAQRALVDAAVPADVDLQLLVVPEPLVADGALERGLPRVEAHVDLVAVLVHVPPGTERADVGRPQCLLLVVLQHPVVHQLHLADESTATDPADKARTHLDGPTSTNAAAAGTAAPGRTDAANLEKKPIIDNQCFAAP